MKVDGFFEFDLETTPLEGIMTHLLQQLRPSYNIEYEYVVKNKRRSRDPEYEISSRLSTTYLPTYPGNFRLEIIDHRWLDISYIIY